MIRVIDRYNLLDELCSGSEEFVKVGMWEEHDIDVLPCHDDTMMASRNLTIFINNEPDRIQARNGAFTSIRSLRPNNIFLVAEIDNQHWPFPTTFYPNFMKETVRLNDGYQYETGKKHFLADALLGGMSHTGTNYRNNMVTELENQGLLEDCLINLMPRSFGDGRPGYRSSALDELDDPDFISKATGNDEEKKFNTMVPNADCGFGQVNYLSQIIPRRVYDSAYLSLVAETETGYDGVHLSEKISKPLVSGKPFLLFGAPKYLEALRHIGFKTFDQWWSEDYDGINDHNDRILAIVNSLKTFHLLPEDTKINYMEAIKAITEHNQRLCRSDVFITKVREEIKRRLHE